MIEEFSPLETLPKPGSSTVASEGKLNQNPRSNPVCLELAVTIRTVPEEGVEPSQGLASFTREEARTVIVFDNGAVLRLATNIPPGQAVILSNPQGRDVACRIVNNRNSPNVKGYIEIEFLEATPDFWSIHRHDGQPNASNPSAAAVVQSKTVTQPQILSSEPPPAAPVAVREEPGTLERTAATGVDATPEGLAGVAPVMTKPTSRVKTPEPPPRIPAASNSNPSALDAMEGERSYLPSGTSRPAPELTSLTASWEGMPAPARNPSTSHDTLGKYSHTTSGSASTGSGGNTTLIIGAAAAILVALGAGMFLLHRGTATGPSIAAVAPLSQPAAQVPPVPARPAAPESPAEVDRPIAEPSSQASSLSRAATPNSPARKETADPSTTASESLQRQIDTPPLTQSSASDRQQPEPSTPKPQLARNLDMSTPIDANRSGKLVDGSVPNIDDATVSSAVGLPGGGWLSTAAHPSLPPPAGFAGTSSPGETASEPKLISSARPVYPPLAKQANIEGDVIVAMDIDARGNVVAAKAIAGPMYLREAAVDAVKKWQYRPGSLNGKPMATQKSVTIQFRLK